MDGQDTATQPPSTATYCWYVVGILAVLYAISFIDRFMLALAVDPIKRELGVSDAQMGFLLGGGFSIVYALGGLPIAQLLDRRDRRTILVVGVVVWSLTTLASAFAHSYAVLISCRAGVALGEAVLTPAAVSLIADLFSREKRGMPVSIYAAVSSLMGTGAFIVDGAALRLATQWAPLYGGAPWRGALLLVGAPGLLVALVVWLTVREPERRGSTQAASIKTANDAGFAAFVSYLGRQWRFYLPYYLGTGFLSTYGLAIISWAPTLLVRGFGMEAATTGFVVGMVCAPCAVVGAFFWPWLAIKLERRGRRDGIVFAYLLAAIVATPFFIAAPLVGSPFLLLAGFGIALACTGTAGTLTPLAIQAYGPSRMRARLMALTLLAINLIGFTSGPLIVASVARYWPEYPRALGYGFASLGIIAGPCTIIALALCRWAVTRSSLLAECEQ